jgi:titin
LIGNIPDAAKWIRNGGRVIHHSDGSITYIKNGFEVVYNSKGFPDFTRYLYNGGNGLSEVTIEPG